IDNINILPVSCSRPIIVQIDDVTKNSVEFTVTPDPKSSGNVSYRYEVRESGNPGSGPVGLIASGLSTTPVILVNGLQPSTKYYLYIKTVCSSTDESIWTDEVSFHTLCNYPELITAPSKTVCGPQEVDLTAIFDSGTVYWYDSVTQDSLLHTGANFRTPFLTSDTSYWVQAGDAPNSGGSASYYVGPTDPSIGAGGATNNSYMTYFTVVNNLTLYSVDVYPSAIGQNGSVGIYTASGSLITSIPFVTTASGGATAQTVIIDTPLTPGDYYLKEDGSASLFRNTAGAVFPYTAADISITGTSFTTATYYYNFYNWQIGGGSGGGCPSPLYEVKVSVEPKPAFELSTNNVTSCSGDPSEVVTISSNLGGYDTFVWTPSTGVSGDAVNGWTFSTTDETDYVLSASQSNGICEHLITVRAFASANPVVDDTLESSYDLCKNDVAELKALESMPANVSIGLPILTTGINSGMSAYVYSAEYSRQQYIYSAAELAALGVDRAGYIDELAFETINSGASLSSDKYTVRMKSTTNTTFASNDFDTGGFVTVFSRENHSHSFQGMQAMPFDIPFYWDGQSNILVEITQEGGSASGSNNAETYYHSVSGSNNVGVFATSSTDALPLTGTRTGNRLNVRFGFSQSEVTWSPTSNLYLDAATTIQYTPG